MDEPDGPVVGPGEVEKFWDLARFHAKLNPAPSYFGPTTLEMVTPPAFSLGDDPAEADAALAQLRATGSARLTTPRAEFPDDADLPSSGSLGIVLDGAGHPRALVETGAVEVGEDEVVEDLRVVYDA